MNRKMIIQVMREKNCPEGTIEHGEKIAALALKISKKMEETGLKVNYYLVELGALIHDIGIIKCKGRLLPISFYEKTKIEVPKDILMHAIYSEEIAREIGLPRPVCLIALRHEIFALSREERAELGILPLPEEECIAMSWEEKAVMYADALPWMLNLKLDPWNDCEAAAKSGFPFLREVIKKLTGKDISMQHLALKRANFLSNQMKEFARAEWLTDS